ncbi:MAG: DoxX family protein [Gemmatimonadaceae bacterium]|nr:DoxX family protein [Gemmatimonadaceae bacterium]
MPTYSDVAEKNHDRALLVLRLVIGAIFIMHGYQKVFGYGISGVTNAFTQMGVPVPTIVAPFAAVLELVGGIALLLGIFTRVAALLLACDMLGAIILVHGKNGFFLPKGFEFVMSNLGLCVALALAGAGAYSLDAAMARRGSTAP